MREVTAETVADYLRETGRVAPGRAVEAEALGWGVSNVVIRVDVEGEPPVVIKQARERLRTESHWVSRLDRVWNEREALDLLGSVLPEGTVPRVLFSDGPNFLFAMTCAPDDSAVWKGQLLAGESDPAVARSAGALLATAHASTRGHPALGGRLADTAVFGELRVDPFYRTVARVHPEVAPRIEALVASMSRTEDRCLVLGDFSPKNILVHSRGLTLVDFETAHAGDPAFDLGFFLSHLTLKALFHAAGSPGPTAPPGPDLVDEFLSAYAAGGGPVAVAPRGGGGAELLARGRVVGPALGHLAACMLARVDGKSPVDYLSPPVQEAVRTSALAALRDAPLF